MNSFGSLPWVGQCFIGTRADIRSDQGVHCFGGDFRGGLTGACELRHLSIKDTLLVAVYFEGCQDVDFLDEEEGSVLFAHFLGDFCKQSGSVCVLVSLAEKFDGFDFFVLFDEVAGVSLQELFDLHEIVLFSQLHRLIPLIKQHTAINSPLHISKLDIRTDSCITQPHTLKSVSQRFENGRFWGQNFDQFFHAGEVLEFVVGVLEAFVVLGEFEVFGGFCPFLAFGGVVAQVFVRLF